MLVGEVPRPEQPSTSTHDDHVEQVRALIHGNHCLTLNLPTTTIVAPPCKVRKANDNYSCLSFGNADRAFSFYLTAQCLNTE
jgi:hypothetical protein